MSPDIFVTWALETGLAVALLIAFILIIRRPFARLLGAGAAYSLWLLPLIRFFMPHMTFSLPEPLARLFVPRPELASPDFSAVTVSVPIANSQVQATATLDWAWVLLGIWAVGVIIWLAISTLTHIRLKRRLIVDSRPLPSVFSSVLYQAQRQIGVRKPIDVRLSNSNSGPLIIGLLRPVIILPQNFSANYSYKQQYYALAHELAHFKRGDLWVSLTGLVFKALNWPNPLIYVAAKRFRADQEAACDAFVVRRLGGTQFIRDGYAETLVHAARQSLDASFPRSAPLGLTIYHPLKERLMNMKSITPKNSLPSRLGLGACLVGALALTAPLSLADGQEDKLAGEVHAKTKSKQVMKWVVSKDGEKSDKHYEIITEDGVKTAYKISEDGSRTEVEMSEIDALQVDMNIPDIPDVPHPPGFANVEVIMMGDEGDKSSKRKIKVIRSGQHGMSEDGSHNNIIVKKMTEGQGDGTSHVYAFSSNNKIRIDLDVDALEMDYGQAHTQAILSAASSMVENLDDADMSDKARRKLERARKALKEAEEALEAEK